MTTYTDTFCPGNVFIGISGIIGVGKSTLARHLGNVFNSSVYYEPVEDNKYLSLFYSDIKKYSFPMQVYLLNHRFEQHQQIVWSKTNIIQDRTIYEDVIFAKMLRDSGMMDELDFQTYRHLYQNMSNYIHRPDLIVYLDVEPEEALRRVQLRSRECETTVTLEYLTSLKQGYEDWLQDIEPRIPVLRVDWNTYKTHEISDMIRDKLKETRRGLVI